MKKLGIALFTGLFVASLTSQLLADSNPFSFIATANVPVSAGASMYVLKHEGANPASLHTGNLDLALEYNATYGDYRAKYYYAIVVAPTGSQGTSMIVAFSYTESRNPISASTRKGLGYKVNVDFTKFTVANPTDESDITTMNKVLLYNVATENENLGAFAGKALKIYLGGNIAPFTGLPTGAEGFNLSDKAGDYTGTFKVTATIS